MNAEEITLRGTLREDALRALQVLRRDYEKYGPNPEHVDLAIWALMEMPRECIYRQVERTYGPKFAI